MHAEAAEVAEEAAEERERLCRYDARPAAAEGIFRIEIERCERYAAG